MRKNVSIFWAVNLVQREHLTARGVFYLTLILLKPFESISTASLFWKYFSWQVPVQNISFAVTSYSIISVFQVVFSRLNMSKLEPSFTTQNNRSHFLQIRPPKKRLSRYNVSTNRSETSACSKILSRLFASGPKYLVSQANSFQCELCCTFSGESRNLNPTEYHYRHTKLI